MAQRLDVELVATAVADSPKYRHICCETISRVASWAVDRSSSHKEAVKRAKRKLHQVYAAYLAGPDLPSYDEVAHVITRSPHPEVMATTCLDVLSRQASTRERLPVISDIYDAIARITGRVAAILDVGSGLLPFALPLSSIPRDTCYVAWEIDERLVRLINLLFASLGQNGRAECRDVLCRPPAEWYDVVLLLKVLPCLEQQEKGCAQHIIAGLQCRWIVISFPSRSLSGRRKGMESYYGNFLRAVLSGLRAGTDTYVLAGTYALGDEVFWVIERC